MPLDAPQQMRLPSNGEAEQALLGALLVSNAAYERIADALKPEHFAEEVHSRIFAAIGKLVDRGTVANVVTLKNLFDQDAALAEIGGAGYLARLAASVVTIVNAPHYAAIIRDCWARREAMRIAEDLHARAADPDIEVTGAMLFSEAQAELDALEQTDTAGTGPVAITDLVDPTLMRVQDAWQNRGTLLGVTTGLIDLDRALGGLMAGELYILAGRPGMGKSTTGKTIALAAARAGNTVSFFSLEMSAEQLATWCLADITGISASRQRQGGVDENDLARLTDAGGDLRALPLFIDDTPALSMAQIRARARRLKRKHGMGLLIVDHLGLVMATKEARKQGETAAITEITKQLKQVAKELHVPIVALCQLNRGVESRDDKRPGLADLRQSGSIEQDADVVIMCYRAEYYRQKSEPEQRQGESPDKFATRKSEWQDALDRERGLCDLIIAKNRSGPEAVVKVKFEPEYSRMANLARWVGAN